MKKTIFRIFPTYLIFLTIVTLFYFYNGGMLNSSDYLSVLIPLTTLFAVMVIMLTLMGRPPVKMPVSGSWENAVIDFGVMINRKRLRRWVSCSWGFDDSYIYIYTFGKIREKADIKEIADIFDNGSGITIVLNNKSWIISGRGIEKTIDELMKKAGLKK